MATVPGGIFDTGTNPDITGIQSDLVSSFLNSLGLSESNITQLTVSTTGVNAYTSTDLSGSGTQNTLILPSSTVASIPVGSTTIGVASTGANTVINIESSGSATTLGGVQDQASAIADQYLPGTGTGNAVKDSLTSAISNLYGSGTDKTLTVTNVSGVDGTDTVTIVGGGNSNDIQVVALGNTGANVVLDGASSGLLLTGKASTVTVSGASDNHAGLISFAGKAMFGGGNDTVTLHGGTATVVGGLGSDQYIVGSITIVQNIVLENDTTQSSQALTSGVYLKTNATISDFNAAEGDTLGFRFEGVTNFAEFVAYLATAKQIDGDVVATTRMGDKITLTGVAIGDLTQDMFNFS